MSSLTSQRPTSQLVQLASFPPLSPRLRGKLSQLVRTPSRLPRYDVARRAVYTSTYRQGSAATALSLPAPSVALALTCAPSQSTDAIQTMSMHNSLLSHRPLALVVWLLTTFLLATFCSRAISADDIELPPRLPGLVAHLATGGASGAGVPNSGAQRVDLLMQHAWDEPAQFDPRLAKGAPVKVTWRGGLEVNTEGSYQLHLYVAGEASLTLDGKEIIHGESEPGTWLTSQPVELHFGVHELQLRYENTAESGKIGLYWQGPGFQLEPISERYLTHASSETPGDDFERGRLLAHALRCAACHQSSQVSNGMRAPDLSRLEGNLNRQWLQSWLTTTQPSTHPDADDATIDDSIDRRMPHFGLSTADAADVAAALWKASLPLEEQGAPSAKERPAGEKNNAKAASSANKQPPRTEPDAAEGKKLFDTRGCLACHTLFERELGQVDLDSDATYLPHHRLDRLTKELFDGGDLSAIAVKRPAGFFERWLANPAQINAHHRMPTTALSDLERKDVALYLASLQGATGAADKRPEKSTTKQAPAGNARRGKELLAAHRCGACHQLPASLGEFHAVEKPLTHQSHWDRGCLGEPDSAQYLPGFQLTTGQRRALQIYWTAMHPVNSAYPENSASSEANAPSTKPSSAKTPADLLLAQKNCTACHTRGSSPGIAPRTVQLAAIERELASLLPALQPPSLTGVGDKLHEHALQAAIEQSEPPRRPWLEVRMPKYALDAAERKQLIDHFIAQDRIPERQSMHEPLEIDVVTRAAAARLVTSEGFGCQSCHQIGKQLPPTVALNARGTDLTMLGQRVRHAWFDRWVRNPVRIVPRMEMPAIQTPVHGVLGNDLDRQIDSVWEMLNTEGFQPPAAAPVRIVRGHNRPDVTESAHVLTDILETPSQVYLRPLIVGLGNRHNVLFDLEKGQFGQWWIGDTARELTRGKSWYWEMGGQPLSQKLNALAGLQLRDAANQIWEAKPLEQFAVEFDALEHTATGITWNGRITFVHKAQQRVVPLELTVEPLSVAASGASGIAMRLKANVPGDSRLILQLDPLAGQLHELKPSHDPSSPGWSIAMDSRSRMTVKAVRGKLGRAGEHELQLSAIAAGERVELAIDLETDWPVDEFIDGGTSQAASASATTGSTNAPSTTTAQAEPIELDVVPGFDAIQLPLPRTEMPTAFAWYRGDLIAASLKGRVLRALDRDGDGLAETWEPLSDDLPAPYGVAASEEGIDVVAKFGVLRLSEPNGNESLQEVPAGTPWSMRMVADGWGYTADYHDWAVGLTPDGQGNYFVALPCQQDDRSPSAARLRGTVQKLIPQSPTSENPRAFRLETFCAGQRFPMGLAFNSRGNLFATDNQGNYNPFNELNHLQPGKRYGFINKLENRPGFHPPLESPAVNLPHPWTRSVNGICFLDTPSSAGSEKRFGPFEGHLIGCEYNGLSLIRMSLEEVDGVYQGAAYLFSRPPVDSEPTFEGPVTCSVAPSGDVYVGNIHDSGWGGGQNTGSIVRLTPNGNWPLGIGTVSALNDGLSIEFTGPVDAAAAGAAANYSLRSYRRISTPAYGGSDQDERQEKVLAVHVAPDRKRVELRLDKLREDCVYELRVGPVAGEAQKLFPNEAHYTMKRVPK